MTFIHLLHLVLSTDLAGHSTVSRGSSDCLEVHPWELVTSHLLVVQDTRESLLTPNWCKYST